jgi:hypothetical protein
LNITPPDYLYDKPFKVFEVVVPFDGAKVGQAAPWFGQPGLGTQFELPKTIGELIELGWIREVP